jgi:L-aminopeptidase/D-esterase-like protein
MSVLGRTVVKPGKMNAITDVAGIEVGHYTDVEAMSGVTVIMAGEGAVAGVDIRGSAPGTRETDVIAPQNLVQEAQAVVLSGGSVFGLAAADGVVRWLEKNGRGFRLDETHVAPIVPAAVIFDLGRGKEFVPPIGPEWGKKACDAASSTEEIQMGSMGAGTGALSGGIKGGTGTASLVLESGISVAACVVVNSLGSVIDPATGRPWEIGLERNGEFGIQGKRAVQLPPPPSAEPAKNTTIAVIATDAALTKNQAQKIAQMAHDGMARAIRPVHTMFDGDTVFCLATGKQQLSDSEGFFPVKKIEAINELGYAGADCMTRAIIHGILSASSLAGIQAFCDLPDRKRQEKKQSLADAHK